MDESFNNNISNTTINNIDCKPKYLYKYISLEKGYDKEIFNNLENDKLYFSNIREVNDKEEYKNLNYRIYINKSSLEIIKNMEKHENKDLVCCFTGGLDNDKYMWENYANSSKGIRLTFEVLDGEFINKITYTDEKQVIEECNDDEEIIKKNVDAYNTHFFRKSTKWKNENEYRATVENFMYPCVKRNYSYEEVGLKLLEVTIGKNCSKENKLKIEEILKNKNIKIIYQ
jgi:hypothetical protein